MSFSGFSNERKSVRVVWLLNLVPPGGLGTVYACGPKALIFLIPFWCYLSYSFTPLSLLFCYFLMSVWATIAISITNMNLQLKEMSREKDDMSLKQLDQSIIRIKDLIDQSESGSFALNTLEAKVKRAEKRLTAETVKPVLSLQSSIEQKVANAERLLQEKRKQLESLEAERKAAVASEAARFKEVAKLAETAQAGCRLDSNDTAFKKDASIHDSVDLIPEDLEEQTKRESKIFEFESPIELQWSFTPEPELESQPEAVCDSTDIALSSQNPGSINYIGPNLDLDLEVKLGSSGSNGYNGHNGHEVYEDALRSPGAKSSSVPDLGSSSSDLSTAQYSFDLSVPSSETSETSETLKTNFKFDFENPFETGKSFMTSIDGSLASKKSGKKDENEICCQRCGSSIQSDFSFCLACGISFDA